jgi:Protein of unknown function (DUF2958).
MKLLTPTMIEKLTQNGKANAERLAAGGDDIDFYPVVKLFTPDGAATWLLSEILPDDPDIAFGLCDLGLGCPEFGTVRISELEAVRGPLGLPVERDLHFKPTKTIGAYGLHAVWDRRIVA